MDTVTGYAAQPLPVVVIGASATAMRAAHEVSKRGFAPIVVGEAETSEVESPAPDILRLPGRRATSVWGSLEAGFNVEVNTGETITGAAVIVALSPSDAAPTGFARLPCAVRGETDLAGVQVVEHSGDQAAASATTARVVDALLRRIKATEDLAAAKANTGGRGARRFPTTH